MTQPAEVGISGFALYVPPYRVALESWCSWTRNSWPKISKVVGQSFRMAGPAQNAYTMAATAAYRLIQQYDVDPEQVGFLGFGTESSTDNSAGAIIIRGMLDEVLQSQALPTLSRNCQVPEYKHACLGGVYAMKDALRWLALGGDEQVAIVVASDIAAYPLGSSGEPTQGAGAVAILLERNPQLLEVDIRNAGSSSAYRAIDFRKPHHRSRLGRNGHSVNQDVPVFNGDYSVSCYLDQTLHALQDMTRRLHTTAVDYYRSLEAVFMHRPYQHMVVKSWALNYLAGLAGDGASGRAELAKYCRAADLDTQGVVDEIHNGRDLMSTTAMEILDTQPYPLCMKLLRNFRTHQVFHSEVESRIRLGVESMREIGNTYAAALPAWIAAGLEQAYVERLAMAGKPILALGYGSGDAAEAIPMQVADGWEQAASRIRFRDALRPVQDLDFKQYYALHTMGTAPNLEWPSADEFLIESVGCSAINPHANDGIETYCFNRIAIDG